jgi:hypothetical protein
MVEDTWSRSFGFITSCSVSLFVVSKNQMIPAQIFVSRITLSGIMAPSKHTDLPKLAIIIIISIYLLSM